MIDKESLHLQDFAAPVIAVFAEQGVVRNFGESFREPVMQDFPLKQDDRSHGDQGVSPE